MCSNVEMILNSHNPCETFESVSEPSVPSGPTRAGGIARRGHYQTATVPLPRPHHVPWTIRTMDFELVSQFFPNDHSK